MEATQSTIAINNKKRKKGNQDCKNSNSSRVLSTPRTRSQVSPEWTAKQALILVNEIAAVDKDCSKAVSTNQKWKIIVGNCVALDVTHTLSQCRSKWNSLVIEYNQIKKWDKESGSRSDFYWSLGCERRKEFGLPENFDDELFKAIDDYMWSQKEQLDTDPGAKKQRRWLTSLKTHTEEKTHKCCRKENSQTIHAEDDPWESSAEEEPHTIHAEEWLQPCCSKEKPQTTPAEEELHEIQVKEKPQKRLRKEKPQIGNGDEKPKIYSGRKKMPSTEDMEQMMVEKLSENAEMIQAVVNGNFPEMADLEAADSKNIEGFKTDLIRSQGDKLIACLQNIVNSISQFPCLLQEGE